MHTKHSISKWITPGESEVKNCIRIICIAAIVATVLFLPFVLYDRGIFLLYGDYNVQQIPFYQLAHDTIRNGNMGWSYTTDLGSNFIASYSFYLLGSPFFWLTIPFPTSWLPYLMAPLFVLKFCTAALTSYAFLRRFTKTPNAAMIGALLYAFSGFMVYNIFYNHFHEVVAFFPLLLLGMENLMVDKKRGRFALAVALNLIVNYYFFVAEVVFLILYFILRCACKGYRFSWGKLGALALESVLGGLMGMVLLLPSAIMTLQNPRVAEMLFGYDMLFYNDVQRYGLLLQSLFFPPDMPAFPNFFPDANAKWYSVAAYLPLFGMVGVLTFLREKRHHWLKYLLLILGVMMLIPFLNSAFNGFNANFYTRWLYMLTLMMSLATAMAIENPRMNLKFGLYTSLGIILAFSLIGILPSIVNGKVEFFSMPNYPVMFFVSVGLALVGLFLVALLLRLRKRSKQFYFQAGILLLCGFIVVYGVSELTFGKVVSNRNYYSDVVERGLNAEFVLDEDAFFRIDIYYEDYLDNWSMFWGLPSIQAFQSTVNPSIMEFYQGLGMERSVASRIEPEYDGLRELLSVEYLFVENNREQIVEDPDLPPGFTLDSQQNGFDIYKNQHFIPMGFCYDAYIDQATWDSCPDEKKDRLLLKGIYRDGEPVGDLPALSPEEAHNLSDQALLADADARRAQACHWFATDNHGFSAHINLSYDNYVFFSIPYENGWQCTVNGEEVPISKVDNGLMAVPCSAGSNEIRFDYHTPGLWLSIIISIVGILLFVLYRLVDRRLQRRNPAKFGPDTSGSRAQELKADYTDVTRSQMHSEYKRNHRTKKENQSNE